MKSSSNQLYRGGSSTIVDYPIKFSSRSEAESGEEGWSLETDEGLKTEMSVPEEFDGTEDVPSPEDLFSASIMTCVVATFKSIAERKDLEYSSISAEAEGVLDRGEDTRPVIKEAEISVQVKGVEDTEKAKSIASATEKNCFIHNSVKTDVKTKFDFQ